MSDSKVNPNLGNSKAKELELAKLELKDLTEALQRERADSVNMRRQHELALANAKQYGLINVIRGLLPAVDSLERSLKHVPEDLSDNDYVKGVQAVVKQFDNTFLKLGIERIETVGQEFNPRFHEAIHLDESKGGTKEIVSEELQAGYLVGEEVIRHAMVNVQLTE